METVRIYRLPDAGLREGQHESTAVVQEVRSFSAASFAAPLGEWPQTRAVSPGSPSFLGKGSVTTSI